MKLVYLTLLVLATSLQAGDFRAAASQVEITPKNGTPLAGYYHARAVAGMLDPLYAKTIIMEQDGVHAALVVLDVAYTTQALVDAARAAVQKQCGIEGDHVMISATHTHTGPTLPRLNLMDKLTQADSPPGVAYMQSLPDLIAKSVNEAKAKLAPVTPAFAIGDGKGISFNRRVLKEGTTQALWQPKTFDPATMRPAGPVDPEIGVLVFNSNAAASKPVASLLNFAMHPTSVGAGTKVSADFPGVFTKLINERHGPDMVSVFANGCCGNINPNDYFTGTRRNHLQIGALLADATDAAWPNLKPLKTFAPRIASTRVMLNRRSYSEAEIAKAKDIATRMVTKNLGTVTMAEAVCILETISKQNEPLSVEVQAIAFSDDAAIVALPGEIFVELGLALKKQSPFKHTMIAELANGSIGYIPDSRAYPQGNYEVVSARCAQGSGELLVKAVLKLLKELTKK
ncbi:neutral/alkaline non-lysosomal ceramidase N-terminal domain-containing protein [Prosthecobacter sp.]|uniref:neutral/alkaline non-lysosomal ceramidase N-terminal domain-containing protein n=1 Tax=Prosthecobacter sp. TaxID=1965333 RepID=UPI001D8F3A54|nr:neutral/alkaline non-lysosomal ceramidase N-terminal domain-containing protein [Prosthecobacter sp.]MCB1279592.1 neutral/alkaline non-lysosomal ceramidase N-terminal domain-containing protein [Prosthecobacter sp.]